MRTGRRCGRARRVSGGDVHGGALLGEGDEAVFERGAIDAEVEGGPADGDEVGADVGEQRAAALDAGPPGRGAGRPGRRAAVRSVRTSISASVKRTVAEPPSASTIAAGVPSATTRPWSITTMRSHSRSASSTSWVTRTTVVPASRTWRTTSHVWRRAIGSRFWVSSSRNTSSGRPTRARATNSRWRSPPDRAPNGRRSSSPSCHSSTSSLGRARRRVQRGEQRQRLADAHPLGEGGVLQLGADAAAQPVTVRRRDRGRGRGPFRASARRRPWRISTVVVLPAPFVPSRPNSSPRWTVKRDVADDLGVAVALDEAVDLDDRWLSTGHASIVGVVAARRRIGPRSLPRSVRTVAGRRCRGRRRTRSPRPVADAELGEDRADVALHGRLADDQGGGDLGVRRPSRHLPQDVVLALGQGVDRAPPRPAAAARSARNALEHPRRHLRVEPRARRWRPPGRPRSGPPPRRP